MENERPTSTDFIRAIINEHNRAGRFGGKVVTRFPPEPNGYLHIGHAKSINLNFGIARDYAGRCHLRFDDTNPTREEEEYVQSIMADVRWMGGDWGPHLYYASDYFGRLHEWAVQLIQDGKAYVDDQSADQIRENRGTLKEPGRESPWRNRTVEENLDLFARMGRGEFDEGSRVLRAKINMTSPNMNLRDPVMYRILKVPHNHAGDQWCIYPMYDYAHGQSDSIEGITHSICTLEFEEHRPLYDWFINQLGIHHPQQIEFARLNITYTVLSKRRLITLVTEKLVRGWDDPRMPTISGLRRRGYTPEAIRDFCDRIGVAKADSTVDVQLLEHCLREDLNKKAPRVMGVLNPLKVVVENLPSDQVIEFEVVNNPEDPTAGSRKVPFTREILIERDDFMEDPPKKFFRLAPGREVRLRGGCFLKCNEVKKDAAGAITELLCAYDPATLSGEAPDGRKVKATIHWVSATDSLPAEVRLYDHLFTKPDPDECGEGQDWLVNLNPNSLTVVSARVEKSLAAAKPGDRIQFERLGYFCVDPDSAAGRLVFNRAVTLRDDWAKAKKAEEAGKKV